MRFETMIAAIWMLLAVTGHAAAHPGHAHGTTPALAPVAASSKPVDALGTVAAFSAALARGDTAAVLSLLAENVAIYESGGKESSREEYASHHLPLDIAFLAA